MTGAEHYKEGERYLRRAEDSDSREAAMADAAIAQAHFAATQAHGALYLELKS